MVATIPYIVTSSNTPSIPTDGTADIVVRDNATYTIDATSVAKSYGKVAVYPTAKLIVKADNAANNLTFKSLEMLGGIDIISGVENKYQVPQLQLTGSFKVTSEEILYRMRTDKAQQYQVSFPYDVAMSAITRDDAKEVVMNTNLLIKKYNGANRADGGRRGDETLPTWEAISNTTGNLTAGTGYTIASAKGYYNRNIINFPMAISGGTVSQGDKDITVSFYEGTSTKDIDKGWNLLGNPYLSQLSYAAGDHVYIGSTDYSDNLVVYIPYNDGTDYYQGMYSVITSAYPLLPFKHFFVQASSNTTLTFHAPVGGSYAPETISPTSAKFCLHLQGANDSDDAYFRVADDLTAGYDIMGDNEKMFGSAKTSKLYSIYGGDKLLTVGINKDLTAQPIQLGFIASKTGQYTINLNEVWQNIDNVTNIYLYDNGALVADLMTGDYGFTSNAGTFDSRFQVLIVMGANAPTQMQGVQNQYNRTVKVLRDQQIQIFRNGAWYNALGHKLQ